MHSLHTNDSSTGTASHVLAAQVNQTSLVDTILAEYNALRREIDIYHDHQKQLINFAVLILAGLASTQFAPLATSVIKQRPMLLLLIPVLFVTFAHMFADRMIRILRLADYIHNCARPTVSALVGHDVWQWEHYKQATELFDRRIMRALDRSRWAIFMLPSCAAVTLFGILRWDAAWGVGEFVFFACDLCYIGSMLILMLRIEETGGVRDREVLVSRVLAK
jgi:hypothetical protein